MPIVISLLTNLVQHVHKPGLFHIKRFATLDPREFDSSEHVALVFVMADHARLPPKSAFHGKSGTTFDQMLVLTIRRGRTRIVAALLHQDFFSSDHGSKLLAEPFPWHNCIQFDMSESIARQLLATRFLFLDDVLHTCAF